MFKTLKYLIANMYTLIMGMYIDFAAVICTFDEKFTIHFDTVKTEAVLEYLW